MSAGLGQIPFDSVALKGVANELQAFVGSRVERVDQSDAHTIGLELYGRAGQGFVLISADPVFPRVYLSTRRLARSPKPPGFLEALRARCEGATITDIVQIGADRMLEVRLEGQQGLHRIVAELTGKHANLVLVDGEGRIVSVAKVVGRSQSVRPVAPGLKYESPPVLEKGSPRLASPFLRKLEAQDPTLGPFLDRLAAGSTEAFSSDGFGAYPLPVRAIGYPQESISSLSVALERHYERLVRQHMVEQLRQSLLTKLDRVLLARDVALDGIRFALADGGQAVRWQRFGELILAYQAGLAPNSETLEATDYDGSQVSIPILPNLTAAENADRYFKRAKRAKSAVGPLRDQLARLTDDRIALIGMRDRVAAEKRLDALRDLEAEAHLRRWLMRQLAPARSKADRPYEGHRIRELLAPGGWTVLYGENAEANDFLTLRVAKPSDWWLHVRGSTSAHVLILTKRQPEKVQRETLVFAAKVAVRNSPSKHADHVPVDYTLRRYVRRQRGGRVGSVVYDHEKTLHIDAAD